MYACGASVDLMGQELPACGYCARQNEIASQDYDAHFVSELLGGVEESKEESSLEFDSTLIFGEESEEDKLDMMRSTIQWAEHMDAEAAKYTTLTPQKRERVEGVTYTMFKPFDYSKRIRASELEDFKEFLKIVF